MIKIELTIHQAEELKDFYVHELERIQKRGDEIREILVKIGTNIDAVKTPESNNLKETPLAKESQAKNPGWSNFILQVLQEQQKPLSRKVLIKLYLQKFNIRTSDSKNLVPSLSQALFILRTKKKLITSIKTSGKNEKLYGLTEWDQKSAQTPVKAIKTISPPSTGRKLPSHTTYNWPGFIIDTLNNTRKVLSAKEFLHNAIVSFSIPDNEIKYARNNLSPTLSYLAHNSMKLKTVRKTGQKGRSYGLTNWFNENGDLIADYK